jgi:hypothetical protein
MDSTPPIDWKPALGKLGEAQKILAAAIESARRVEGAAMIDLEDAIVLEAAISHYISLCESAMRERKPFPRETPILRRIMAETPR